MSEPIPSLPPRASLEYLRKCAKERLDLLRSTDPDARLADAQLQLAREYGFSSWRAMKAHVDRATVTRLCDAAAAGDVRTIRELLAVDKGFASRLLKAIRSRDPLAVAHQIPGVDPLRRLLKACARRGVPDGLLSEARACIEQFENRLPPML